MEASCTLHIVMEVGFESEFSCLDQVEATFSNLPVKWSSRFMFC